MSVIATAKAALVPRAKAPTRGADRGLIGSVQPNSPSRTPAVNADHCTAVNLSTEPGVLAVPHDAVAV